MANATVRAYFGNGASVSWATVDNADAGPPALKFDRSDSMNTAGNPVPIPTSAGTNFSWIKHVILDVTASGTTNMLNRRVSQAAAQPTGIALYWRAANIAAYVQANNTSGNAEGNKPSDNGTTNAVAPTPATVAAPAAPAPTNAATGGTVAAGVYTVQVSYTTALNGSNNFDGESLPSASGTTTTTGATSTLTVPSPAASGSATGWYAYVSQPGGSTLYRQQAAGSPTAIGTGLTLTAPPTTSGANPPTFNSSGYTAVTTSNVVYDNTTVATSATGTNGAMCILVLGVDNTYTGGAGSAIALQNLQLTYDEQ